MACLAGFRGDFIRAAGRSYYGSFDRTEGERRSPARDVHGHIDHVFAANSEHGG